MIIDPRYLAGVIDSDGSISVIKKYYVSRPTTNYSASIQLTWVETPTVKEFMQQLVNQYGGSYFGGFPSGIANFPNSRKILKYCATGVAAELLINDIKDFLVLKKIQALNLLELRRLTKNQKKNRPLEITEKLENMYTLNKSLNTKNGTAALCT